MQCIVCIPVQGDIIYVCLFNRDSQPVKPSTGLLNLLLRSLKTSDKYPCYIIEWFFLKRTYNHYTLVWIVKILNSRRRIVELELLSQSLDAGCRICATPLRLSGAVSDCNSGLASYLHVMCDTLKTSGRVCSLQSNLKINKPQKFCEFFLDLAITPNFIVCPVQGALWLPSLTSVTPTLDSPLY